jgi:hypothetical protein
MLPIAFLIHEEYEARDLVTLGHVAFAALVTLGGCILVIRNRRLVGYAVGFAALPSAIIAWRMFWATLQFDLRQYPGDQLWMGLVAAVSPYLTVGMVYGVVSRWHNKADRRAPSVTTPAAQEPRH